MVRLWGRGSPKEGKIGEKGEARIGELNREGYGKNKGETMGKDNQHSRPFFKAYENLLL